MNALIYKELRLKGRRLKGLVLSVYLLSVEVLLLAGLRRHLGNEELIGLVFLFFGLSMLLQASLQASGALSEEWAAGEREALLMLGLPPRSVVLGKFLALWLLAVIVTLSAAPPFAVMVYAWSVTVDWSLVSWLLAAQAFLVAVALAASAEPVPFTQKIGRLAGWAFVLASLSDPLLGVAELAVATLLVLAVTVDRFGGAPLVALKRLCGLLAALTAVNAPGFAPLAWGLAFLAAVDALIEPIESIELMERPAVRLGRALSHPLAAAAYPLLLFALGFGSGLPSLAAAYALLALGLVALLGRLGRRFFHPLLPGLGAAWFVGRLELPPQPPLLPALAGAVAFYLAAVSVRWREARLASRERLSEDAQLDRDPLPEGWPAALVKELTQLMRGRWFLLVFSFCLLFQLGLVVPLFFGRVEAALFPVEAGALLFALTALSSERRHGRMDLLLLAQSPSRLVWGKWAALALVQLMLFSLSLPILVAAYYAANADLLTLLSQRLLGLALSAAVVAVGLWVSSMYTQLLPLGFLLVGAELSSGPGGLPSASPLALSYGALALSALAVELAADQLSPLPAPQTTRNKRLLGLLGLLAAAALLAFGVRDQTSLAIVLLPSFVVALDAMWDAPGRGRLSRPLAPGQSGAIAYGAGVSIAVALFFGLATRSAGVALLTALQLLFWGLVVGAGRRAFSVSREWMPGLVLAVGGVQAAVMTLPGFTRRVFPAGVLLSLAAPPRGDRALAWGISLTVGLSCAVSAFLFSPPEGGSAASRLDRS